MKIRLKHRVLCDASMVDSSDVHPTLRHLRPRELLFPNIRS